MRQYPRGGTEAVRLSHRYIIDRQLPDKAISVLDTACARVAIARAGEPPPLLDAIRRAEILAPRRSRS